MRFMVIDIDSRMELLICLVVSVICLCGQSVLADENVSSVFANRERGSIASVFTMSGGVPGTFVAIHQGLRWLGYHQHDDGFWGADLAASDPLQLTDIRGITAFALLAFTVRGPSVSSKDDVLRMKKAAGWLTSKLQKTDSQNDKAEYFSLVISAYAIVEYELLFEGQLSDESRNRILLLFSNSQLQRYLAADTLFNGDDIGGLTRNIYIRLLRYFEFLQLKEFDPRSKLDSYREAYVQSRIFVDNNGGIELYTPKTVWAEIIHISNVLYLGVFTPESLRPACDHILSQYDTDASSSKIAHHEWILLSEVLRWSGGAGWERWNRDFSIPVVNLQKIANLQNKLRYWSHALSKEFPLSRSSIFTTAACIIMLSAPFRYDYSAF